MKSNNMDIMNKLSSNKVDVNEYVNCVLQLQDICEEIDDQEAGEEENHQDQFMKERDESEGLVNFMHKMRSKHLKIRVIYEAHYHDSNIDDVLSTKKAFLRRMDQIKQI